MAAQATKVDKTGVLQLKKPVLFGFSGPFGLKLSCATLYRLLRFPDSLEEIDMAKAAAKTAAKPAAKTKAEPAVKAAAAKPKAKAAEAKAEPAKVKVETVTLKHLAATIAETHELSKKAANAILDDLVVNVTKHLKKGARVRIGGLGILQVRKRAARMGRNPATGEAIKIKASKKVAFRPAKELKEAV
jgi:DNA-binding protein HU-beta